MRRLKADASGPKVLFLGMTGAFSLPPLEALLRAGVHVCGVVVPGHAVLPYLWTQGRVADLLHKAKPEQRPELEQVLEDRWKKVEADGKL